MDVAAWLQGLGLERYVPAFRDNEIDWDALPKLSAEDLKDLGVVLGGHRRRLLDAIAALGAAVPAASATAALRDSPAPAEAERRQLTVMFCDLVGSTELAARLDPEDLREVIAAYHRAVAQVVAGFDGFVAKYMGDGVLIYFGYPKAHEDDAERAVRAGLGVIDAVGRLNVKSGKLQARVGVATGLVVVGDLIGEGSAQEQSVVGETPNLAARLQAMAEPNAVVIAAGTRRLVGDLFEVHDLGAVEVRGIAAPVPAWRVLRPSVVASRFEALRGGALSPLVGRDEEIDLLLRRWARAKAGDGQVVLISGEPGLGKSRLTAALAERLHAEPYLRLRYFCSPYHQDSALFPFIDQLGRASGFARDDPPAARLEKLEALLARAAPPEEDVGFLADLLSLPGSERHPLPNLSPQRQKERTLEALIRQLEGLTRRQPVLLVFEDAHWIDPTSRELLDLTIESVRSLPVLLIVTFRPEFQSPWTGQPQVTMLALNRLDRRDRTALVERIADGMALPDEILAQIVDRTDGVPLFIEELTKSVLETGVTPLGIPATLHDSLMARLDRVASVRRVAQIGAAIGREFSYELLGAVSLLPEDELQSALARLVASELVFQRGMPPDAVYAFKHALVQDVAHGSLLRRARQQLHAQIAEALETHSSDLMDSQPELFAQHYAEAGHVEKSIAYWGKAGHRSAARSAMAEAAAQFQKGLDQLALLLDTPERRPNAFAGHQDRTQGNAKFELLSSPQTRQAYARARELWEQLGSPSEFLNIPYGQSLHYAMRGAGRFGSSRLQLKAVLALYDPRAPPLIEQQSIVHSQIASQVYLGSVLFCLGFPDQAMAQSNAAIAEAQRLAHPPSVASNLSAGVRLLSLVGDNAALDERANELIAVATEQDFPLWGAQGTIFRGWGKVRSGDVAEGMALLRSGTAAYRATGAELWMPYHISLLAGACELAGQVEEAVTLLDDALQLIEKTGERWFEAELNRCKGQLLLRQGHPEAAEELYRKALNIAEEQEAKLWELRAAASLARLRCDQSRQAEARDLLAPVYAWFTEGFDTADLKDAKALLAELT